MGWTEGNKTTYIEIWYVNKIHLRHSILLLLPDPNLCACRTKGVKKGELPCC